MHDTESGGASCVSNQAALPSQQVPAQALCTHPHKAHIRQQSLPAAPPQYDTAMRGPAPQLSLRHSLRTALLRKLKHPRNRRRLSVAHASTSAASASATIAATAAPSAAAVCTERRGPIQAPEAICHRICHIATSTEVFFALHWSSATGRAHTTPRKHILMCATKQRSKNSPSFESPALGGFSTSLRTCTSAQQRKQRVLRQTCWRACQDVRSKNPA